MADRPPNTVQTMENATCFDLNTEIRRWRQNLSASPQFYAENLEELESHLREGVAALRGQGLSAEEAFLVARRRLGGAPALESEFAKINAHAVWLNRLLWMLLGIQGWWLLGGLSRLGADALIIGSLAGLGFEFKPVSGQHVLSHGLLPATLFALAQVATLAGGAAALYWLVRRKGRGIWSTASALLRRPWVAGLATLAGCAVFLSVAFAGVLETPLLFRGFSLPAVGAIQVSKSLAAAALMVLQTFALASLTVVLARKLRPRPGL